MFGRHTNLLRRPISRLLNLERNRKRVLKTFAKILKFASMRYLAKEKVVKVWLKYNLSQWLWKFQHEKTPSMNVLPQDWNHRFQSSWYRLHQSWTVSLPRQTQKYRNFPQLRCLFFPSRLSNNVLDSRVDHLQRLNMSLENLWKQVRFWGIKLLDFQPER